MVQFSSPTATAHRVCVTLVAATCALLAGAVYAQHAPTLSPSLPANPAPLAFDSVLSRYKPMTDQKLGTWREANDNVGQIGGWRTYLKEVQQPEVTAPAPAAPGVLLAPAAPVAPPKPVLPTVPAATDPHAGHGAKR